MTVQKSKSSESNQLIEEEDLRKMIAEAAYYHAEHRGFEGGNMDDDWYFAEAEIKAIHSQEKPHR